MIRKITIVAKTRIGPFNFSIKRFLSLTSFWFDKNAISKLKGFIIELATKKESIKARILLAQYHAGKPNMGVSNSGKFSSKKLESTYFIIHHVQLEASSWANAVNYPRQRLGNFIYIIRKYFFIILHFNTH